MISMIWMYTWHTFIVWVVIGWFALTSDAFKFSILLTMILLMYAVLVSGGNPLAVPILLWRLFISWYTDSPFDWTPIT